MKVPDHVRHGLLGLLASAVLLASTLAMAADGDPDPAFGTDGKVTTSLATFSSATDVAVQADGKIIVVGTLAEGLWSAMVIARYDQSGVLDPEFNSIGYVTALDPTFGGNGVAVVIQPDGRILALGRTGPITHGASALFLVRFEANGDPDETFGNLGMAQPVGLVPGVGDLAVLDSGQILISYVSSDSSFNLSTNVARLLPGGGLDSSFGNGGIAKVPGFPFGGGASLSFRSDGQIVVGTSNLMQISPMISAFAAGRLSSTGAVDTSFGTGGVSPAFGDPTYIPGASNDVALQFDDRIVLAGANIGAFALVGMGANGGIDSSFATNGLFTDSFATRAFAVLAHGGNFLAAGGGPQFALARVTPAGALDPSFGVGGRVTTSFGDDSSIARAIAVQSNGAIVVVGTSGSSSASTIALARYLGTPIGCTAGSDADGDGVCDADDECPDGSPFSSARLVLSDFDQSPCSDRLLLKATLALPSTASIDPDTAGMRIVIRDGGGTIMADETLPPGDYDDGTKTGWRTRMTTASATWKFSRPTGAGAMVSRAAVQRRASRPDEVRLLIKGHSVCFAASAASLPLTATVVLTPPIALDDRCGDVRFEGGAGGMCTIRSGGHKIACR